MRKWTETEITCSSHSIPDYSGAIWARRVSPLLAATVSRGRLGSFANDWLRKTRHPFLPPSGSTFLPAPPPVVANGQA